MYILKITLSFLIGGAKLKSGLKNFPGKITDILYCLMLEGRYSFNSFGHSFNYFSADEVQTSDSQPQTDVDNDRDAQSHSVAQNDSASVMEEEEFEKITETDKIDLP